MQLQRRFYAPHTVSDHRCALAGLLGDPPESRMRKGDMSGIEAILFSRIDRAGLGPGMVKAPIWTGVADAGLPPRVPAPLSMSDLIVAVAVRADREAFAVLFEFFAPRVKSYLLRLGADPQIAEELAQEALLTVWRKAAHFDPSRAAASTWIFTIARNLRIDAIRKQRRPTPTEDLTVVMDAPPMPDAALAFSQDARQLALAVTQLPAEQAEVIRLAFYSDKAHSEIAAELGLPLGTVKSRLRLAMLRLRARLGGLQ